MAHNCILTKLMMLLVLGFFNGFSNFHLMKTAKTVPLFTYSTLSVLYTLRQPNKITGTAGVLNDQLHLSNN